MARRTSHQHSAARRALIAVAAAGTVLGAGAATASAGSIPAGGLTDRPVDLGNVDPQAATSAATGVLGHVTGPVAGLRPNPLAGTGVDPLDNGVETQLADFRPVTSRSLTGPVAQAPSIGGLPVLGGVLGVPGR
ncbi:hypothetical protein ACF1BE_10525 [Streptomyces sp. NPDC014991]|uniref:hypothetical protein n=1 Tax=Streptomyces sp. NPDC014991 TaxID=3364935 RepID=UPI0036F5B37A